MYSVEYFSYEVTVSPRDLAEETAAMLQYAIERARCQKNLAPCQCGCGGLSRRGWICAGCARRELDRRKREPQ